MEQGKGGGGDRSDDALESFLAAANCFVKNTFQDIHRAAANTPEGDLLEASAETITVQFQRMTQRVHQAYAAAKPGAVREVNEFLELQQGTLIACNTERTAAAVIKKGVSEGFLVWLARNLQEIKKIIRMILRIIFGRVPAWYDDIALLIDELAHIILGLFASLNNLNASRVAAELSKGEQNFWAEMAALDRVAAMRRQIGRDHDD